MKRLLLALLRGPMPTCGCGRQAVWAGHGVAECVCGRRYHRSMR